jgi:hypothetical protein
MKNYLAFFIIFLPLLSFAQRPKAFFNSDSLQIGKPLFFSLTYTHTSKTDLLFPDSTYNFKPFELIDINYFPTKTLNGKSLDSVVYELLKLTALILYRCPFKFYDPKTRFIPTRPMSNCTPRSIPTI